MSVQRRRKYDPEFKKHALLLSAELGWSVKEVAENLGVSNDGSVVTFDTTYIHCEKVISRAFST